MSLSKRFFLLSGLGDATNETNFTLWRTGYTSLGIQAALEYKKERQLHLDGTKGDRFADHGSHKKITEILDESDAIKERAEAVSEQQQRFREQLETMLIPRDLVYRPKVKLRVPPIRLDSHLGKWYPSYVPERVQGRPDTLRVFSVNTARASDGDVASLPTVMVEVEGITPKDDPDMSMSSLEVPPLAMPNHAPKSCSISNHGSLSSAADSHPV
jgi:hypothetical protein